MTAAEERERHNAERVAKGFRPLPMPEGWVSRPRLNPAEEQLFRDFLDLTAWRGPDTSLSDLAVWFRLREVPPAERGWLTTLYRDLLGALKAPVA